MRRVYAVLLAVCCALAAALAAAGPAQAAPRTITNGTQFTDTSGNPVHAHGGGVIKVGSSSYWFGEDRNSDNTFRYVAGVRAKGGEPVLVTAIVRRWFNADGTLNNNTALLVNGLGVDLPAVVRSVAAAEHVPLIDLTARTKALVESLGPEASKALYLYNEKRDNTHTSVHGAALCAGLVRDGLLALHLVPEGAVRVG